MLLDYAGDSPLARRSTEMYTIFHVVMSDGTVTFLSYGEAHAFVNMEDGQMERKYYEIVPSVIGELEYHHIKHMRDFNEEYQ